MSRQIIGYRAKVNFPKMLAGEISVVGDPEWASKYPELLEPIYFISEVDAEKMLFEIEAKVNFLKQFIKNK